MESRPNGLNEMGNLPKNAKEAHDMVLTKMLQPEPKETNIIKLHRENKRLGKLWKRRN